MSRKKKKDWASRLIARLIIFTAGVVIGWACSTKSDELAIARAKQQDAFSLAAAMMDRPSLQLDLSKF